MVLPSHATGSFFQPVALEHASRLVNHGPTVLVTSAFDGRRNVMAAAWSMPVEFIPPRIAVVIDKKTFTRELIMASGRFGLCLPGSRLIDVTYAVGNVSGRDEDKFVHFGLATRPRADGEVPLIEDGCAAWLECRLIREPHTEDAYDTCFGEVVDASADARVFSRGHWTFDDTNVALQTIHHLGGGNFVHAGAVRQASERRGS